MVEFSIEIIKNYVVYKVKASTNKWTMNNRSVQVKAYNKIRVYICNNELVNYKVTTFVLIRIEIKFLYKIINNIQHSVFCLNVYMLLFL